MKEMIINLVREITADNNVQHDDELLESEILDSVGIAMLLTEIESRIGIVVEIEDVVPENFATIDAIIDLLKRYKED